MTKFYRNRFTIGSIPQLSAVVPSFGKIITISGQAGAGTNYQVPFLIGESAGSGTNNFHLGGLASLFPTGKNVSGSLRFIGAGSSLSFWVEDVTGTAPNRVAKVWVKVAEDLSTNKTISCVYIGDTTNVSNGDNTFVLFDDFEGASLDTTTKWTVDNSTGMSVSGGSLIGTNTTMRIRSKQTFSGGVELIIKSTVTSRANPNGHMLGGFYISPSNGLGILDHPGSRYIRNDSNWVQLTGELPTTTMYSRIKVYATTADIKMYNFSNMTLHSDWGTVTNTVSSEPVSLGYRYDDLGGGQTYNGNWDYLFVKKVQATEPAFLSAADPGAAAFPTSGLISYYPFDSNANDIKGTNHGTPSNITYTTAKKGNGATITGDTGYITIPAIAGTDLTVSFWHLFTSGGSGSWHTLLCRNSGTYHHVIIQNSDNKIGFYNGAFFPSSFTMVNNTMYHIIITKSGTNQKMYINNVLVLDSNSSFDNNLYNLSIIGNYASSGPSQGALGKTDEMAIYNRVVTEAERNILYNNGEGTFY